MIAVLMILTSIYCRKLTEENDININFDNVISKITLINFKRSGIKEENELKKLEKFIKRLNDFYFKYIRSLKRMFNELNLNTILTEKAMNHCNLHFHAFQHNCYYFISKIDEICISNQESLFLFNERSLLNCADFTAIIKVNYEPNENFSLGIALKCLKIILFKLQHETLQKEYLFNFILLED